MTTATPEAGAQAQVIQGPLSEQEIRALPVTFPAYPTVARLLHLRSTAFYEAAKRDALPIPVTRVVGKYIAKKKDVLNFLGMTEANDNGAGYQPAPPVENTSLHQR